MTDPVDPGRPIAPPPEAPAPDAGAAPPAAEAAPQAARPALHTFSLEGRRAPGLYLVGWLATAFGGPLLGVAVVSGSGGLGGFVLTVGGASLLAVGLIAAAGAQAIERRGRADLAYRGPSPALVFAASVPLLILLSIPILLTGIPIDSPPATLVSVVMTELVWIALVGLTVVGTGALGWSEIAVGIIGSPAVRVLGDLALGAAAAFPVVLVTAIVAVVVVSLVGVEPQAPIAIPSDRLGLLVSLIAAAVAAPIGEEIFYRGFVTTAWARSYGPVGAVVRGGLFFAIVHVLTIGGSDFEHAAQAALVEFLTRIPVALALGWIFVTRRSLAASIGLHATFNGTLVLIAALAGAPA